VNPLRGFPGHPSHPPLTDATIGAYTFATVAAILSKAGVAEHAFAQAWWLALIVGAASSLLTVGTGFLDWLQISSGSPLWRTATLHALTATIIGFVLLTAGGTIGGSITYVHGMRVLNLVEEPTRRAIVPSTHEEKEKAAT
jgi:uncharacterized membrane protein